VVALVYTVVYTACYNLARQEYLVLITIYALECLTISLPRTIVSEKYNNAKNQIGRRLN